MNTFCQSFVPQVSVAGERSRRRRRIRTCVAMVEKFPEYAVYSAKIVFVEPLVTATKA